MIMEISGSRHLASSMTTPEEIEHVLLMNPLIPLTSLVIVESYQGEVRDLYGGQGYRCSEQLPKVKGLSPSDIIKILTSASGYRSSDVVLGPGLNLADVAYGGLAYWVKPTSTNNIK